VVQDGPGRKLWRRVPDGSARFAGTAGAAPGVPQQDRRWRKGKARAWPTRGRAGRADERASARSRPKSGARVWPKGAGQTQAWLDWVLAGLLAGFGRQELARRATGGLAWREGLAAQDPRPLGRGWGGRNWPAV